MQKRKIDFEKFDKWLKEGEQEARRFADKKAAEGKYFDAAELSAEANTYEFISVLINEVPEELPDFVIVEEEE